MHTVPPFRPWCNGGQSVEPWFSQALAARAWAIGVARASMPSADGVLSWRGLAPDAGTKWFGPSGPRDALWSAALSRGVAAGKATAGAGGLMPAGQHILIATRSATDESSVGRVNGEAVSDAKERSGSVWYAVAARPKKPWSEAEARHLRLALRRIQAAWDHPVEPGLGRVLLGHVGRVLHADAHTHTGWPTSHGPGPAWVAELRPVIVQRWGHAAADRVYDICFAGSTVDDTPRHGRRAANNDAPPPPGQWVRVRHHPAEQGLGGYDFVETRPLDPDDAPPVGLVDDDRVAMALGYLTDHYAQSPGLKEIARRVESSPFHFHRLFSRVVGVSPKHYLLRTQLQMAKWKLRIGHAPVGDVATAAGFASHGHFTATFHRLVGESPTDYRERHAARQGPH